MEQIQEGRERAREFDAAFRKSLEPGHQFEAEPDETIRPEHQEDAPRWEQASLLPPAIAGAAVISACKRYRYRLSRIWDPSLMQVNWVMLNPSTADASHDDATMTRVIGFTKRWGYGGLVVTNLFAYRSKMPVTLSRVPDPAGPENDEHVAAAARESHLIVVAWGASPITGDRKATRQARTLKILGESKQLFCLGQAARGEPLHPLYLSNDTLIRPFIHR